jgi:hypothetical protein
VLSSAIDQAADTTSLLPAIPRTDPALDESYAPAETIIKADEQLTELTNNEVDPFTSAQIAEEETLATEAAGGDRTQIASPAPFPVGNHITALSENTTGGASGTRGVIEQSVPLSAAPETGANDGLPEPSAMLAERSLGRETTSAGKAAAGGQIPALTTSLTEPAAASPSIEYVQHFPMVVVNGTPLGAITVREFSGNERRIHLGALLSLFRSRMDQNEYERLISAGSADQFVSLEELRRAGLNAHFDTRRQRLIIEPQSSSVKE